MLSVFGFSVESYEVGRPVPETLDLSRPGCVVADVRMPGTDGIELVRELARRKSALSVVLISGHADVPMAVAAIKAGAEDFIEKPVDDVQLVAAINRGLARTLVQQALPRATEAIEARFARLTPRQVEIFDLVAQGFTSQAISSRLDDQHPHGRKLPRAGHGEDAGRKRRRAGAAGDPARPHHPVEIPWDRCGCTGRCRLDKVAAIGTSRSKVGPVAAAIGARRALRHRLDKDMGVPRGAPGGPVEADT